MKRSRSAYLLRIINQMEITIPAPINPETMGFRFRNTDRSPDIIPALSPRRAVENRFMTGVYFKVSNIPYENGTDRL